MQATLSTDQALILMYHRIADPGLDPWALCVSPENFGQHLQLLSQHYEFIKLSDLLTSTNLANKVVITFDDGYLDNLRMALPILKKFSAPATVFVTSGYIGGEREFWWDELEQLILLAGDLPESLNFGASCMQFQFDFKEYSHYPEHVAATYKDWKVTYDGSLPPTERHVLFLNLWSKLQDSSETSRRNVLDNLFSWAGRKRVVRSTHRPMREAELVDITHSGLVEIGSHCVTHGALPGLSTESKRLELESSKSRLEAVLGNDITSLAYPHGEYDLETLRLAEAAGYSCALGTQERKYDQAAHRFQIPRMMAMNYGAKALSRRLGLAVS